MRSSSPCSPSQRIPSEPSSYLVAPGRLHCDEQSFPDVLRAGLTLFLQSSQHLRRLRSTLQQLLQCLQHRHQWWIAAHQLYIAPALGVSASPAPVNVNIAPAPAVWYVTPAPALHVVVAPVVQHSKLAPVVRYITSACRVIRGTSSRCVACANASGRLHRASAVAPAQAVDYIMPAPVVMYIAPARAVSHVANSDRHANACDQVL